MSNIALSVKDLHIRYHALKPVSIKNSIIKPKRIKKDFFHAVKGVSLRCPRVRSWALSGRTAVANPHCSGLLQVFFHRTREVLIYTVIGIFVINRSGLSEHVNRISEYFSFRIAFRVYRRADSQQGQRNH